MKKILIIEDEQVLVEAYTSLLRSAGYDVRDARNGHQALEVTHGFRPDLIFLDLRMPIMSGIEFLQAYELKDKHPEVKVIIFSNYDMQDEIEEAYELGAERYVLKAWASPREILALVDDSLGASQASRR